MLALVHRIACGKIMLIVGRFVLWIAETAHCSGWMIETIRCLVPAHEKADHAILLLITLPTVIVTAPRVYKGCRTAHAWLSTALARLDGKHVHQ